MAFTQIQTVTGYVSTTTTTKSVTVTSTGQNNLIYIHYWLISGSSAPTVTDNVGNSYTVSSILSYGGYHSYVIHGMQLTGGATSIDFTFTSGDWMVMTIDEYSGFTGGGTINNTSVLDGRTTGKTFTNGYNTATLMGCATLTPSSTGRLLIASYSNDIGNAGWDIATAGSGFTLYGLGYLATTKYVRTEYNLSGGATTNGEMSVGSLGGSWSGWVSAFRVPSSTSIKTINGLAIGSVKTVEGLAIGSLKTKNGLA
jgi:hypothetical protein